MYETKMALKRGLPGIPTILLEWDNFYAGTTPQILSVIWMGGGAKTPSLHKSDTFKATIYFASSVD